MTECSKTHLQQSTISKFSGGGPPGPPALRGGEGREGREREARGREPTSKGRGGNGERGEGEGRGGKGEEGKGNICRTNVKLLPAPLICIT